MVAGTNTISAHSYGRAIDINPLINPYIVGNKVMPANATEYADRDKALITRLTEQTFAIAFSGVTAGNGVATGTILGLSAFYKEYDSPLKMAVNKLKRALLR